ncbi:MAG: carbonate dehydratase [Lysobacter sp.]|nr:carbonate dehydratase [Lysobacter sp.]
MEPAAVSVHLEDRAGAGGGQHRCRQALRSHAGHRDHARAAHERDRLPGRRAQHRPRSRPRHRRAAGAGSNHQGRVVHRQHRRRQAHRRPRRFATQESLAGTRRQEPDPDLRRQRLARSARCHRPFGIPEQRPDLPVRLTHTDRTQRLCRSPRCAGPARPGAARRRPDGFGHAHGPAGIAGAFRQSPRGAAARTRRRRSCAVRRPCAGPPRLVRGPDGHRGSRPGLRDQSRGNLRPGGDAAAFRDRRCSACLGECRRLRARRIAVDQRPQARAPCRRAVARGHGVDQHLADARSAHAVRRYRPVRHGSRRRHGSHEILHRSKEHRSCTVTRSLEDLLRNNRAWAERVRDEDPDFFKRLSRQQAPKYLWIGCSDSRVPANQILGLDPGEVFVHRNVANLVVHTDLNCLSSIQFAVDLLKVEHILIVGHYGCSGVHASLTGSRVGLADNWLRHVGDVAQKHAALLDTVEPGSMRHARLCELNVIEQVTNVCQTTVVQDAWARDQPLTVHGWIYGLHDGKVRQLGLDASSPTELAEQYPAAVAALGNDRSE